LEDHLLSLAEALVDQAGLQEARAELFSWEQGNQATPDQYHYKVGVQEAWSSVLASKTNQMAALYHACKTKDRDCSGNCNAYLALGGGQGADQPSVAAHCHLQYATNMRRWLHAAATMQRLHHGKVLPLPLLNVADSLN